MTPAPRPRGTCGKGKRVVGGAQAEEAEMTERPLSGRRIIVMGGTGSLGQSVIERFHADGASVVAADAKLPDDANRRQDVDYVAVDALDEASVLAALATSPAPTAVVNLIGGSSPPRPPL